MEPSALVAVRRRAANPCRDNSATLSLYTLIPNALGSSNGWAAICFAAGWVGISPIRRSRTRNSHQAVGEGVPCTQRIHKRTDRQWWAWSPASRAALRAGQRRIEDHGSGCGGTHCDGRTYNEGCLANHSTHESEQNQYVLLTDTSTLGKARRDIAVAVCELLDRTRRCLMKFREMFHELKTRTEFAVEGIGVVADDV